MVTIARYVQITTTNSTAVCETSLQMECMSGMFRCMEEEVWLNSGEESQPFKGGEGWGGGISSSPIMCPSSGT